MAYDSLYKSQVPVNCSMNKDRGPALNKPTATLAGLMAASFVRGLLTTASRAAEKAHYQREFRPGHHPTLELPVVPSDRELMFSRTGTEG